MKKIIKFLSILLFIFFINSCNNNANYNKDIIQLYWNIEYTNKTIKSNNKRLYKLISNAKINDLKATSIYEASLKVQKASNNIKSLIRKLKTDVVQQLDNNISKIDNNTLENVVIKDNVNVTNEYFLEKNNGDKLKKELIKYRNRLIDIIKSNKIHLHNKSKILKNLGDLGINLKDIKKEDWINNYFYNKPIAIILTRLSFIENTVINAEFTIINKLISGIENNEWIFYTVEPKIIPVSTHIKKGDIYVADLFLNKYYYTNVEMLIGEGYDSKTRQLTGVIDTIKVENGVGKLKIKTKSVGLKKFSAIIIQKNYYSGEIKKYPVKVNGSYDIKFWVVDD